MKKIGNLEGKVIVSDAYAPNSKDVIWRDSENNFKESIDGEWVNSPKIPQEGGGGDEFPYEYACPDDFSVTIQPEDWRIDGGSWANLRVNIPIISPVRLFMWKCNSKEYDISNEVCIIRTPWGDDIYVDLWFEKGKIYEIEIGCYFEMDRSVITPLTLNFTDLLFIGNKKEQ